MTIVDSDQVEPSNLNRQLEAIQATVGQDKTEALKERILSINPDIKVICKKILVDGETVGSCFDGKPDYVIDAMQKENDQYVLTCKFLTDILLLLCQLEKILIKM